MIGKLLLIVLALGVVSPGAVARAAALPERTPPSGFAAVNGPAGGRTLAGTFTGNARSAALVLSGMVGLLRGYFDGTPAVSAAVGDPADRGIMAFFDARLQGTPVRGAVIVQLNDGGGGGVANKGFSYYIRGLEVLEHSPSGRRGNFDRDFADAVVKADPTKFRLVPPSQYRTTD